MKMFGDAVVQYIVQRRSSSLQVTKDANGSQFSRKTPLQLISDRVAVECSGDSGMFSATAAMQLLSKSHAGGSTHIFPRKGVLDVVESGSSFPFLSLAI